jgi:hypothetical protein
MAGYPKALVRANAATAGANATVPAGKQWVVTNIILTNYGSAVAAATVKLDGITLIGAAQLGIGGTMTLDCAQVLDTGKILNYSATVASTIAVHISGVEMDL